MTACLNSLANIVLILILHRHPFWEHICGGASCTLQVQKLKLPSVCHHKLCIVAVFVSQNLPGVWPVGVSGPQPVVIAYADDCELRRSRRHRRLRRGPADMSACLKRHPALSPSTLLLCRQQEKKEKETSHCSAPSLARSLPPSPCSFYKKTRAGVLNDKCNIAVWLYMAPAPKRFYCFDRWHLESGGGGAVAKAKLRSKRRLVFCDGQIYRNSPADLSRLSAPWVYIISGMLTSSDLSYWGSRKDQSVDLKHDWNA